MMGLVRRGASVVLITMAFALVACVHETAEQRATRVRDGTAAACHLIGDYLTEAESPPTGGVQGQFNREQVIEDRMKARLGDLTAAHTPQHDAIAAYIKGETRPVSQEELDSGYLDPQFRPRFEAMLAACDALVPDAGLTALNARLVEALKRRYGP